MFLIAKIDVWTDETCNIKIKDWEQSEKYDMKKMSSRHAK